MYCMLKKLFEHIENSVCVTKPLPKKLIFSFCFKFKANIFISIFSIQLVKNKSILCHIKSIYFLQLRKIEFRNLSIIKT